eukprot:scaffold157943_cov28-Tisochrysis_lutea.AAC.1
MDVHVAGAYLCARSLNLGDKRRRRCCLRAFRHCRCSWARLGGNPLFTWSPVAHRAERMLAMSVLMLPPLVFALETAARNVIRMAHHEDRHCGQPVAWPKLMKLRFVDAALILDNDEGVFDLFHELARQLAPTAFHQRNPAARAVGWHHQSLSLWRWRSRGRCWQSRRWARPSSDCGRRGEAEHLTPRLWARHQLKSVGGDGEVGEDGLEGRRE